MPYVRDDRETPLCGRGTVRISELIWVGREQKYFCKGGWTDKLPNTTDLPVGLITTPVTRPPAPTSVPIAIRTSWVTEGDLA
jgi:hypothetical protein